jgi:hypothetical protein
MLPADGRVRTPDTAAREQPLRAPDFCDCAERITAVSASGAGQTMNVQRQITRRFSALFSGENASRGFSFPNASPLLGVARFAARISCALLGLGAAHSSLAQTVSVELTGGTAINFPTPLIVHQAGYPDIDTTARYDTKPFGRPDFPYYALRISRWEGEDAWEFAQVHHRLFLSNPPADIQYFAIHFGYNYLLLGHAWRRGGFVYHFGVGPILTNPETIVRNQRRAVPNWFFDGGYYFSGIGMGASVEKELRISRTTYVAFEVEFTAANAWDVPISNGYAEVPNLALHFHVGLGHDF